jgi:N-acetyl-alpha-D-glucosaminyl L-malate synthase BshA
MDGVQLEFYQARDRVSYGRADGEYVKHPRLSVALSLGHAARKLLQVVQKHQVDIIHAHWAVPMGFAASMIKFATGTPLAITAHGRDVYLDPEAGAIVPRLWYVRPFLRSALQRADRVIAVSQDCRRHAIQAGAPAERVAVIHNGVSGERFSPDRVAVGQIRRQLGVARSARLILFVGSLKPYKGVDVLIRAVPHVLKGEPSAIAVVVGDGPERKALAGLRDSLGLRNEVLFAGAVPNARLPYYENACDVFVLPSRRESFGVAAAEAMACARPVVATNVGGLREVIDHGETGLLVEPGNPQQLAASILRILKNDPLARRLGAKARRKVEAEFDWASVGRLTAALYREVLEHTMAND